MPLIGLVFRRSAFVAACRSWRSAPAALEQYLPDVVGHEEHAPGGNSFGWTSIATREGSRVRTFVGDRVQVSCHHHQSVVTHPGFEATARAADGTIEAIEDPERPFWLGVQWHPESGDDHGLFLGLIELPQESTHRPDDISKGGDPLHALQVGSRRWSAGSS